MSKVRENENGCFKSGKIIFNKQNFVESGDKFAALTPIIHGEGHVYEMKNCAAVKLSTKFKLFDSTHDTFSVLSAVHISKNHTFMNLTSKSTSNTKILRTQ